MFRKLIFVGVLLLALTVMVGVGFAQDEGEPLKIGLLVDQSGGLTIYGYELEYGFKLGLLYEAGINPDDYDSIDDALADVVIGGRPVEVLVRDNGSVPDTASSQARELIEVEGVEILVGAPSSGVTIGLQQVAADYEVILFAAPGASPAITSSTFHPNTFRVCRNTYQDAATLATFAEEIGTDWMILAADYAFGRDSATIFEDILSERGINFVQEPIYGPLETSDFTPYLQEILRADPDALLTIWAGDNSVTLFQQINELGVSDEIAIVGGTNSNDVIAAATTPEEIGNIAYIVYHYTMPDTEVNDWLVEKHITYFPNPFTGEVDYPDLFTGCSFATAQALVLAVEETAGDTLPDAMIPALEGMQIESPQGPIFIRPSDHQALVPLYITRLDNIDDPEYRFLELVQEVNLIDSAPPCRLEGEYADRCEMDEEFMAMVMEEMGMAEE
ncbi:MAG: substrate-binding domain-containing protein [Phototrophicaceae bacterium]